jgi:hypothetical protein
MPSASASSITRRTIGPPSAMCHQLRWMDPIMIWVISCSRAKLTRARAGSSSSISCQRAPRSSSREAHEGTNLWTARFAGACRRAVSDADSFERRAQEIEKDWRIRFGQVRSGSATDLLLRSLIGVPVITVKSAAEMIGHSFPQTNEAIDRLVNVDVLRQVSVGKRNRAFEAPAIIEAFTSLERQLASPEGDARTSRLARPVPRRL